MKFRPPKYRAGNRVKILSTGQISRVIRVQLDTGINWYLLKDQNGEEKFYAETEVGTV